EVTPWYDGLLGKLICYGPTREEARGRLVNALGEFALLGVTNNAAYLRDIVASGHFRDAELSTNFIDQFFSGWEIGKPEIDAAIAAAVITASGAMGGTAPGGAATQLPAGIERRSPWDNLKNFELWGSRR